MRRVVAAESELFSACVNVFAVVCVLVVLDVVVVLMVA